YNSLYIFNKNAFDKNIENIYILTLYHWS
ncbi:hypothetical protein Q604_UNBC10824G0001, partial [human gut metagenome]